MLKSKGRMIRQEIRQSQRIAALCPKSVALFCLLIPHFNAHGKMNGDPRFIKGEVCPLIPWLTIPEITRCLAEIHKKTNVKWFEYGGLKYLHSLNWAQHQELRSDRKGGDLLPSYQVQDKSGSTPGVVQTSPGLVPATPGVVPLEVEEEVEGKDKGKIEDKAPPENSRTTPGVKTLRPGIQPDSSVIKTFPNKLLRMFRIRMEFINQRDDRARWVKIISDLCLYETRVLADELAFVRGREGKDKSATYFLETVRRRLVDKDSEFLKHAPPAPELNQLIEDVLNSKPGVAAC